MLAICQLSPKSFLSVSSMLCTNLAACKEPACSLQIYKALLSSFLDATLHIAFTETLILLFICIFGKLSLISDLEFLSHTYPSHQASAHSLLVFEHIYYHS